LLAQFPASAGSTVFNARDDTDSSAPSPAAPQYPQAHGRRGMKALNETRAFPAHTFGALAFAGRMFPDATRCGKQRYRSHDGIVVTVSSRDLLSEVFSPSSAATCR
jgi:hypothetical protein